MWHEGSYYQWCHALPKSLGHPINLHNAQNACEGKNDRYVKFALRFWFIALVYHHQALDCMA